MSAQGGHLPIAGRHDETDVPDCGRRPEAVRNPGDGGVASPANSVDKLWPHFERHARAPQNR
jgi:hypothetical protein